MEHKNVFIGNLDFTVTEEDIKALFSDYGTVVLIKMRKKKGCAFIEMSSEAEAALAIEKLNGSTFKDREVRVSLEMTTNRAKAQSIKKYSERSAVRIPADSPHHRRKESPDDRPAHSHGPSRDGKKPGHGRSHGPVSNYSSREQFSGPDGRQPRSSSRGRSDYPHPRRKEWPDDRQPHQHRTARDGKRSGNDSSPENETNYNTWERFPGPVAKPASDYPRGRSDSPHPQRKEWPHDRPGYPKKTSRDGIKSGRDRSPKHDPDHNSRDRFPGPDSRQSRDHSRGKSDAPHPQRKEWPHDKPGYSHRPSGPSRHSGSGMRDDSGPRHAGGPPDRFSRPKSGPRVKNGPANPAHPGARGGAGKRDRNSRPKRG